MGDQVDHLLERFPLTSINSDCPGLSCRQSVIIHIPSQLIYEPSLVLSLLGQLVISVSLRCELRGRCNDAATGIREESGLPTHATHLHPLVMLDVGHKKVAASHEEQMSPLMISVLF